MTRGSPRRNQILLSPPHMTGQELELVTEAFESNWVAPLGPHVDAFEREFAERVGSRHALAVSSGTAALHLALLVLGIGQDDEVAVSTLTFVASVNPIRYVGAKPLFIDSEEESWNLDPELLAEELERRARGGRLPKAVIAVHLYGQAANMDPIIAGCERHGVALIEDAAEALGTTHRSGVPGTFGRFGVFSFNGNKIITTGGGGMLVSDDATLIARARKLATQARDPAPHYQHSEIGYNYRLSNILAAVGRAQLRILDSRVAARRRNFEDYENALGDLPGLDFMPEAPWGKHTRWLTTLTIDPDRFGCDRDAVRSALEKDGIEARPVWKPMHLQPVFGGSPLIGRAVAERLFERGLCLPSGSQLTDDERKRVISGVLATAPREEKRHAGSRSG